jgi:hypothetical protein
VAKSPAFRMSRVEREETAVASRNPM